MAEPGAQLSIQPATDGFTIRGEIDAHTAPALERAIEERLGSGEVTTRLDMRAVTFVDSSGLRVILATTEAARAAGGALLVAAPSDAVRRLIDLTDLGDHLTIDGDAD